MAKIFKLNFDLPYNAHRYIYEAAAATQNPKLTIKRRFSKSNKSAARLLLQHVKMMFQRWKN